MSRKIAFRGGFDNCVGQHRGRGRQPKMTNFCAKGSMYMDKRLRLKVSEGEWMLHAMNHVEKTANSGLYLGLGLCVGRMGSSGSEKVIAAPLIIIPAEFQEDDQGNDTASPDVDWHDPQINLDLLAYLLEAKVDEEAEITAQAVGAVATSAINAAEDYLRDADLNGRTSKVNLMLHAKEVYERLAEGCPKLCQFKLAGFTCCEDMWDALDSGSGLRFFPEPFYFVANRPSEVTTYASIGGLLAEMNRGGITNDTLDDLIGASIDGQNFDNPTDETEAQRIREHVLPRIPLELSDSQSRALVNAWTSRVSYVQGPPGTGKSHTISAIIMSAALLGKRVLLVSNKQAALSVVENKLRDTLGADCLHFAVRDTLARKKQHQKLKELHQDLQSRYVVQDQAAMFARKLDFHENKLAELIKDKSEMTELLDDYLQKSSRAHQVTEAFVQKRRDYDQLYEGADSSVEAKISRPPTDAALRRLPFVRGLLRSSQLAGGKLSRIDALRLRTFKAHLSRSMGRELVSDCDSYHRLTDLVELVQARVDAEACRSIVPDNQTLIRGKIASLARDIKKHGKDLVMAMINQRKYVASTTHSQAVAGLASIFHFKKPARISELMSRNPISKVTECLPFWAAEIKDLSSVFPFNLDMFDLVVVDEASQVNLPEIIPALYRGPKYCIVGDDKQLGLGAAGLFALNATFERLAWERHCKTLNYARGEQQGLLASKDSILDFLLKGGHSTTVKRVTLTEHFRSRPALATFTSDEFYKEEGGLSVMTEVGANVGLPSFELKVVGGERPEGRKYVLNEIKVCLDTVHSILIGSRLREAPLAKANLVNQPSVGIVSFLTEQRDELRLHVEQRGYAKLFEERGVMIGTPEEFQGNERDIIVLCFGLGDGIKRYAKAFYEEPRRFNVATSRARGFTIAVIGKIPEGAGLLRRYFSKFGFVISESDTVLDKEKEDGFTFRGFSRAAIESEFEHRVADVLQAYVETRNASGHELSLHNQVLACGKKRLDFVLYNMNGKQSVAVEVDGPSHYVGRTNVLTDEHKQRVAVLRRAGWKIVHLEHRNWYQNGWLCEDAEFSKVKLGIFKELDRDLGIS